MSGALSNQLMPLHSHRFRSFLHQGQTVHMCFACQHYGRPYVSPTCPSITVEYRCICACCCSWHAHMPTSLQYRKRVIAYAKAIVELLTQWWLQCGLSGTQHVPHSASWDIGIPASCCCLSCRFLSFLLETERPNNVYVGTDCGPTYSYIQLDLFSDSEGHRKLNWLWNKTMQQIDAQITWQIDN